MNLVAVVAIATTALLASSGAEAGIIKLDTWRALSDDGRITYRCTVDPSARSYFLGPAGCKPTGDCYMSYDALSMTCDAMGGGMDSYDTPK
ncbi:uncharacterized protein PSFLO_02742 [Pseudozyma flocculosa]|nr:uncharacterized protein PSFLO_02742 [Pseudozyma flocculosa]